MLGYHRSQSAPGLVNIALSLDQTQLPRKSYPANAEDFLECTKRKMKMTLIPDNVQLQQTIIEWTGSKCTKRLALAGAGSHQSNDPNILLIATFMKTPGHHVRGQRVRIAKLPYLYLRPFESTTFNWASANLTTLNMKKYTISRWLCTASEMLKRESPTGSIPPLL